MRKIKITMAMVAGAILFVLSSCGQIEKPEDGTKVGSGIEKIVESDEDSQAAQNTSAAGNSEGHAGSDKGDSAGDVYSFPDGAPDESAAGQGWERSIPTRAFSDEIAAEISYAEEREKEISEKQKAADTQMDMNITAAEMYQMWDDT